MRPTGTLATSRSPTRPSNELVTHDSRAEGSFWEQPELVERFAAREADVRLMELLDRYDDPKAIRVLDLGCAGGRNAVPLAERGFDVYAIDSARAMVARTRGRLEPILGVDEAAASVLVGEMEDLSRFPHEHFDLVVGLGVYHQASTPEAWDRALAETARVLKRDGLLLYASFHPETAPDGTRGRPVSGQANLYSGLRSGSVYLIGPQDLERRLARLGLVPETPSSTVRVTTEKGQRVTVNGLFRRSKRGG